MNRWNAHDSVFSPLVAAVPAGTPWPGFVLALIVAAESIPTPEVEYVYRTGFKSHQEVRDRVVRYVAFDNAKPFTVRVFASDLPRERQLEARGPSQHWEVGMTRLKDGLCAPAVPAGFETALLQVHAFRLTNGKVTGVPELALLRHLWAAAVQAASSDAIVFGGQHHWDDAWWIESAAADTARS